MEIKYEYVRKRSEFGRPCSFSDFLAQVTVDIPPDPSLADDFIPQDPVDFAVQEGPVMALHEVQGWRLARGVSGTFGLSASPPPCPHGQVNTERVEVAIQGVNHVEGGWPKHVDYKNSELTTRYREEVEREEIYTRTVQRLGSVRPCPDPPLTPRAPQTLSPAVPAADGALHQAEQHHRHLRGIF